MHCVACRLVCKQLAKEHQFNYDWQNDGATPAVHGDSFQPCTWLCTCLKRWRCCSLCVLMNFGILSNSSSSFTVWINSFKYTHIRCPSESAVALTVLVLCVHCRHLLDTWPPPPAAAERNECAAASAMFTKASRTSDSTDAVQRG